MYGFHPISTQPISSLGVIKPIILNTVEMYLYINRQYEDFVNIRKKIEIELEV